MPGEALPLVTIDGDGKFSSHPETIKLLRQQKQNIGVVAVAGLYRTGKSYLLNLLTKKSSGGNGFAVGSSVNACTKGIWIWSEPIYDEEKNIWVYYIDTEGLGSTSRSETHDSRIFALSILLSSFFIYNSRGVIDNQALEDLSLVVSITRTIRVKSSSDDGGGKDDKEDGHFLSEQFPSFLWVLRDFSLKLVDSKGQRITSHTYFENCLQPQEGFSEGIEAKNRIRRLISEFFPDRDCVTLVRPVEDEEMLRNLSEYPLTSLRPQFQKQMENLLSKISKNVSAKKVLGRFINGDMFCSLMESYIDALNSGGAPEIKSAWSRVMANQCNEARQQALDVYNHELVVALSSRHKNTSISTNEDPCSFFPLEIESLVECHEIAKAKSKELFRSKIMDASDKSSMDAAESLKRMLRNKLLMHLASNKQVGMDSSTKKLTTLIEALDTEASFRHTSVENKTSIDSIDIHVIRKALSSFQATLNDIEDCAGSGGSLGHEGQAVLCSKISGEYINRLVMWASNVADAFRKSENSLQVAIHKLELDYATAKSTTEAKTALLTSQRENDDRAATALKEKIDLEESKYNEILVIKQCEITRYESMLNDLGLMHQKTIAALEERIQEYREKLMTERNNVLEEQRRLGEDKSTIRAQSRSADDARDEEMQQLAESVARQESHIAQLSHEVNDLEKKHREEINKKSQDHLNETTVLSRNMENELDVLISQLKADTRRDDDVKQAEIKKMQDTIKRKENQLVEMGVDPGDSIVTLNSLSQNDTTLADPNDITRRKAPKKKSKKSQSCQQS